MSWISCRKSAIQTRHRFVKEPPEPCGSSGVSFPSLASVDHQMTPALFRPLFRAAPSRGLHWRIGCRDPLRGPSVLKHHGCADCVGGFGPGLFVPIIPIFPFHPLLLFR